MLTRGNMNDHNQNHELLAAMDAVMRVCAGFPSGNWRETATRYCDAHGYEETLAWLCERIGICGSRGCGPEPDYDFIYGETLAGEVSIYSHHLKERIVLKRGAFLRIVFSDPTKAQQMSLF